MSFDEQKLREGLRAWEGPLREAFERRVPRSTLSAPLNADRQATLSHLRRQAEDLTIRVNSLAMTIGRLSPGPDLAGLADGLREVGKRLGDVAGVCEGEQR